jgi:hypothetical protein
VRNVSFNLRIFVKTKICLIGKKCFKCSEVQFFNKRKNCLSSLQGLCSYKTWLMVSIILLGARAEDNILQSHSAAKP